MSHFHLTFLLICSANNQNHPPCVYNKNMKYSIVFHFPLKYASFLMASNQATSSHWIIHHVIHFGAAAPHVIAPVDIHLGPPMMLLLASVVAAPAPESYAAGQPSAGSSVPENSYDYFVPSFAIIIVVLVLAVLLMGLFSVFVCWYAQIVAEGGNLRLPRLSDRGLDPRAIESFPIFHYSEVKDHKIGRGSLECAVCINEFEDDETLRLLPKCDHVFHPECIAAWLASHSTCPVCRANLTPTSGDHCGDTTGGAEPNCSTEDHNSGSEQVEAQNQNQISIRIDEDENRDPPQARSEIQKQQNWQRVTKLPRSHSTGHSLVQPGENSERYTLRLPEEVRKQIMMQSLKRTRSFVVIFPAEGSSRRGYRSGPEVGRSDWFGRSDRWVFTKTPPFVARTGPVISPTCANTLV